MKQVALRMRDGQVAVLDVPPPALTPDSVLVDVRASLLSAGTEGSKVKAGRETLVGKARARPDQARQVIDKARCDGLRETVGAVRTRLDQPSALGYSAAGVVVAVGARVRGVAPGDRVACGGGEHAVHADIVRVPGNLVVKLPDEVTFAEGAFSTVGSIALHGVRQADVRLGERVAVVGLGLVGQLAGQLIRAAGCTAVGIDVVPGLLEHALETAAFDTGFVRTELDAHELPRGAADCDAVVITAATGSSDPVELAARLCRDRGRVVIVGDVGLQVPRAPYYDKELDLRFSRSYGPGRYDRDYEERGLDYPVGYVRWTEQRNMMALVDLLAKQRINVEPVITERIPVDRAPEAYDRLLSSEGSALGIVLEYDSTPSATPAVARPPAAYEKSASRHVANVIGTGSFAQRILIPGLRKANFDLRLAASARGLSAHAAASQFGFVRAVTPEEAINDPAAGFVAIATRHASHAPLAEAALNEGKAVFVEKPPCLTRGDLVALRQAREMSRQPLFVGFNRRFAPLARNLRDHVRGPATPIELLCRVSAGPLPPEHWLNDPDDGGGRLLGEGCHFIDFVCWVVGAPVSAVSCSMSADQSATLPASQGFSVMVEFSDGSTATIIYTARGASALPKEYIEAHAAGKSAVLDDFRTLKLMAKRKADRKGARSQDKGHAAQFAHLHDVLAGRSEESGPDPLESMGATLAALESATHGVRCTP